MIIFFQLNFKNKVLIKKNISLDKKIKNLKNLNEKGKNLNNLNKTNFELILKINKNLNIIYKILENFNEKNKNLNIFNKLNFELILENNKELNKKFNNQKKFILVGEINNYTYNHLTKKYESKVFEKNYISYFLKTYWILILESLIISYLLYWIYEILHHKDFKKKK